MLVNHLQGICTDLRYEGFVWNVPGTEDICEYQQSLPGDSFRPELHPGQVRGGQGQSRGALSQGPVGVCEIDGRGRSQRLDGAGGRSPLALLVSAVIARCT